MVFYYLIIGYYHFESSIKCTRNWRKDLTTKSTGSLMLTKLLATRAVWNVAAAVLVP